MGDLRARLGLPALGTPDLVVTVPHDWLPALVEAGAVTPVDGLIDPSLSASLSPLARDAFTDPYFSFGWWHAFGGYLFATRDGGGWDEDDFGLGGEPGYAAARLIRDLRHELGLLPAQSDCGLADGEFLAGRTPMIVNGPWALADYRSVGIDVGIAPVPAPQGAARPWAPLVGVQGIIISADANDPAAAADFAPDART